MPEWESTPREAKQRDLVIKGTRKAVTAALEWSRKPRPPLEMGR